MPVDIRAVRDSPDVFKDSEKRRFRDASIVEKVLETDSKWRAEHHALNTLRAELSNLQKCISEMKKASKGKDPCTVQLTKKIQIQSNIDVLEKSVEHLLAERDIQLCALGNMVHASVPISSFESDNVVLRRWGSVSSTCMLGHWELLKKLGAYDSEKGARVSGRRGYFLRGVGVFLNMALQNYGLTFLSSRGYVPLQPPYTMRKEVMASTAELQDFDEQLYTVHASGAHTEPNYLIATSEQPISAFHKDESLKTSELPIKYAGVSTCFRSETSSSGLDAKGLFRVHQFEKVEQFCLCGPEDSWAIFEEMIRVSEEFYQSLGLPYQVVSIVSGNLNNAAAKKYDLEAWFPSSQTYRELVSCSNCTDYQARALRIRLDEGPGSRLVHMLNATLCASERTLCCLVENFQEAQGVRVPRPLVPYMNGQEFLEFTSCT